jgi:sugar/nucleoside kinase (ribokinase family)
MFDIISIGGATRDVFLVSDKFIAIKTKQFPDEGGQCVALGSKVELDKLVLTTGGGATNAAATFGSLGFQVATITKIGNDSPGKDVVEDLSRFGVSTKYVRVDEKGSTGYSTLLTMKNGERTVLVHRGVSKSFTTKDIDWEGCKNTKWIYLTSLGGNFNLSKKIIEYSAKHAVKVMWNPGSGELQAGMDKFAPLLSFVDVLNINLEEAKLLTKKRSLTTVMSSLKSEGKIRLITDSTNGSYALMDKTLLHAGTTGAKAISRTGAGDAFGSGFLAGLIKKDDLRYALTIGTLNAESVIQKHGAKNGILTALPSAIQTRRVKISTL